MENWASSSADIFGFVLFGQGINTHLWKPMVFTARGDKELKSECVPRRNMKGCRGSQALLLFLAVWKKFLECYCPLFLKFCQAEWFKRCSGFSHILGEVCDKLVGVYSLVKHLVASFPPEDSPVLPWVDFCAGWEHTQLSFVGFTLADAAFISACVFLKNSILWLKWKCFTW